MAEIKSSTHEDLEFDGEAMSSIFEDTDCWLVALDDWEIAVILSSLRYAHWPKRWRSLGGHTWDEIEASISQLEYCLMAGCNVSELLDKFDTLNETLLTLAGRFVTPEDKGIAEVVEDLELTCDTTVNFDTAAIVDAIEALDLTCGDTTVNFDTAAMVDAIEAQTTMQETRSIAEVTAQNTNFSDLVEAVDGLELVANCAPDVNLTCSPDVIVSGGGGGETGTVMPHEPGIIGGDPPDGYEPYVDDLACKLANGLVDDLVQVLQMFIDGGILWTIQVGGFVIAAGLWLASLFASSAIIILGISQKGILGALSGIITQLVQLEDSDLTELINILTVNEEEFVCILYNGQNGDSVSDIKAAFDQALLDHEANAAQRALIDAFLCVDTLNILYWRPTWTGVDIAARLDGYEVSVGCGVCGGAECELINLDGMWPVTITQTDDNEWEVVAYQRGGQWGISVGFDGLNQNLIGCEIVSGSITVGYTSIQGCVNGEIVEIAYQNGGDLAAYVNGECPLENVRGLYFAYLTSAVTVRFTFSGSCNGCGGLYLRYKPPTIEELNQKEAMRLDIKKAEQK